MPSFNKIDNFTINGRNYDRTRCEIVMTVGNILQDITTHLKGISYSETADIQYDHALGSRRPVTVGFGNITSEGTLSFHDSGLAMLDDIARRLSLPSYIYLGQSTVPVIGIKIEVTYTEYAGNVKKDRLDGVFLTSYSNGVNTGEVLYTRDVPMLIGKISHL